MQVIDHRLCDDDGHPVPYKPSPNIGASLVSWGWLVVHYTAGRSLESAASWLTNPRAKASCHLIIGRDGQLVQLVDLNRIAWHAGRSRWVHEGKMVQHLNRHTIGIELDNPGRLVRRNGRWHSLSLGKYFDDDNVIEAVHKAEHHVCGWHVYPPAQIDALREVSRAIVDAYGIRDVLGHDDIAPGRKADPGPAFDMDAFRAELFGRANGDESDGAGDEHA
jgi:N-acetylmuramoyl-L-alanine amidase